MSSSGWAVAISLGVGLAAATGGSWLRLEQGSSQASTESSTSEGPRVSSCSAKAGELTRDRVSGAARDFLPGVLPCVSGPALPPADTLHLRVAVACSGAVSGVELVDSGDWPSAVVACVRDRLGAVSFPEHTGPELAVVDLPLRFPPLDASRTGR